MANVINDKAVTVHQDPIPEHIRLAALAEFPSPDWKWWYRYGNGKLASVDPSRLPRSCQIALELLAHACPPETGFYDFEFHGSGMHLMPPGTSLGIHTDATHHPQKPWRRVASLVYFLNDCDGGELVVNGEVLSPKAGMAASFNSQISHEVLPVRSSRRTLSLFVWEVDHGTKRDITAQFE